MERRNNLTAAQIVGNLELANQALKRYVLTLEEKIAQYERVLTQCPRFRAEVQEADEDAYLYAQEEQEFIELYGEDAMEEFEEEPEPRVIAIDFEVDVDEDEDEEDSYLYAQEVLEALQDFIETYGVEALEEFEEDVDDDDEDDYDEDDEDGEE